MLLLVVHGQQQVRWAQAITVERYEGRTAMGMAEAVKAQHVLPFLPAYCSFAARMESLMPSEIQPPGGRLELAHASVSECWQVADTVAVIVMLHIAPVSASSCVKLRGPLSQGPLNVAFASVCR